MRKWILVTMLMTGIIPVPTGAQVLERELVVVAVGGAFERAIRDNFYRPFTERTGVRVTAVASGFGEQNARVRAMAEMNATTWDIVTSHEITLRQMRDAFLPVDCSRIPNAERDGVPNTCRSHSVARTYGGGVITYRTDAFGGRKPSNWSDFWNVTDFPGPRTLPNVGYPWDVLIPALLADGVPRERLFPLDLDRAFRSMDRIKPHVGVWWRNSSQATNALRSGEAVMGWLFDGSALNMRAGGAPVDVEFNQGIQYLSQWSILRQAPHPNAAYAFLNDFLAHPDAHASFTNTMFYGTANRTALASHPPETASRLAATPENWNRMIEIDYDWLVNHSEEIISRWNEWLSR